ncbi:MAG TPA: SDR family oxidoreductase [Acidobacteriota bacterium]|nr:SDR family oxidoreductase [Acidobacteriota bacterium]
MREKIFLTGATGFLGSHLAWRLIDEGRPLKLLLRSGPRPGEDRIAEILSKLVDDPARVRQALQQVEITYGDVSLPQFGLRGADYQRLRHSSEIWHCAASLSFAQEDREETFRTNLAGACNVLRLAEQTPSRRLHFVSTAYIAGTRQDIVREDETFVGQDFKNPYEESKCLAELMIKEFERHRGIDCSIYRPSIVVGSSRDGRITHFHGVYAFVRGIVATLQRLPLTTKLDGLVELPLRIVGIATQTLNMVPVDYVIDAMHSIGRRRESVGKTFHIVNPAPTVNRVWLETLCKTIGITGMKFVARHEFQSTPMNAVEKLFSRKLSYYAMYLSGEPVFDDSNTRNLLRSTGISCPRLDQKLMQAAIRSYLLLVEPSLVRA